MTAIDTKKFGLVIAAFIPLILFFTSMEAFDQNPKYHSFADGKMFFGIANFNNVFSNILFLVIPIWTTTKKRKAQASISWFVFLFGVALVAPGSAYYHYNPNNLNLVWDRLPMTIAFMGLTSFAYTHVFNIKNEALLLFGFISIGIYSVWHWVYLHDLRFYYWIQLVPLISLIYIALFLPSKTFIPIYLVTSAGFYILAKICESFDEQIYHLLNYSGHSIKHFFAAFAVLSLVLMHSHKNCHIFKQQSGSV